MSNGLPDLYEQGRQAGIREALVAVGNKNEVDSSLDIYCDHSWDHSNNYCHPDEILWETHGKGDDIDSLIKYLGLGGERDSQ